ncbi:MAG TPA: IPT/TIG domain-containing protein, partial [Candidatus Angelobacter sp.]|nr:IPT/TIG domain-containing protein [Candidatus Angelobacter sp.]
MARNGRQGACSPTSWTDTQIVANVPTGAATGQLLVTVNSTPSNSYIFEVPNPVITSVTPPEAPAGGIITIAGSGFGPYNPYAPTGFVNLNGAGNYISVVSWSDTSITAEVMDHTTSGTLTIAKFDATSNGVPFTVEGPPTIASISPDTSAVGSTVTIAGSGFGPSQFNSTLQFYGVLATVASWTDTQIIATVPPGTATGPVNVFVAGVKSANSQFTVKNSVQVTDSLGHVTNYAATMLGGAWHPSFMMGSGCSSCTIRGALNRELDSRGNVLSNTDELQHKT